MVVPVQVEWTKEPLIGNDSQTIESKTHGFPNTHEAIDCSYPCEYMG